MNLIISNYHCGERQIYSIQAIPEPVFPFIVNVKPSKTGPLAPVMPVSGRILTLSAVARRVLKPSAGIPKLLNTLHFFAKRP